MRISNSLLNYLRTVTHPKPLSPSLHLFRTQGCLLHRRPTLTEQPLFRRLSNTNSERSSQPADREDFKSIVDAPAKVVKPNNRKHGPTIYLLAAIPLIAFGLGCWQVQRLGWKTDLIARFEDRLIQPPLPLPPTVDLDVIHDFDYRRVYTHGKYRHDQEMLIGPRIRDGIDGFVVVTPLEREGGCKILVNRGWIAKTKRNSPERMRFGLPLGEVSVQGLLREPLEKNLFTPDNNPEKGEWYFPSVYEMAEASGSEPVWVEATMQPDLMVAWDREEKGIPIGRPAEVNLRNNHTQYVFTWYSLSFATTIMFWMVLRKPPKSPVTARRNVEW